MVDNIDNATVGELERLLEPGEKFSAGDLVRIVEAKAKARSDEAKARRDEAAFSGMTADQKIEFARINNSGIELIHLKSI